MVEFHYGGEWRPHDEPAPDDDAAWARQLFDRQGIPAVRREWWYHLPSGYWFIAERHTATGEFVRSYDAAALRTEAG